jgi:hypothetical protein
MIAGFYAIAKHHGDLENIPDCAEISWIRQKLSIVRTQSNYIQESLLEKDYQTLLVSQ